LLQQCATHVVAPAQQLIPFPEKITFEQAAALMTQGSMAHILSHAVYALKPTDRCLIHSIAGGVGLRS
jgi:NADPH2:quinone reductase